MKGLENISTPDLSAKIHVLRLHLITSPDCEETKTKVILLQDEHISRLSTKSFNLQGIIFEKDKVLSNFRNQLKSNEKST